VTGLLEDKVVIVAGLGGIGNGLARRYADEGALLVIGDLDAELAARVATDLDPSGQRVRGIALDGADEESVISIVALAVDSFGRLDGMHVNFTNAADAYEPNGMGDDNSVRVVVLSGNGAAFCAGADLGWMRRMAGYEHSHNLADAQALADMLATLDRLHKPTIARVHGPAFAGGVGLVAACDMAVGTPDAKFCFTEVKLGLSPATISPFVVRAMGGRAARRYFLSGEVFDANEAFRLGLLSVVVPTTGEGPTGIVFYGGTDGFRVTFGARHRQDEIDLEWWAEIAGEADGTITYTMDAVAHTAFRYCKIGFNVHHPLLETVGRRYRAVGEDGQPFEGAIEAQIEPQRVVDGTLTGMFPPYSALDIDYLDGASADFAFEGDLFELQDHRNWADGNFKSYGTPLALPWPMDAEPGQRFVQRVVISSTGLGAASAAAGAVEVELGAAGTRRLPALGLGQATEGGALSAAEADLVRLAAPTHVRVPARLHLDDWRDAVRAGAADCAALGAAAELAVSVEPGDDAALDELAALVRELGLDVARVLVLERQDTYLPAGPITTEDSLARVRARLRGVVGDAPFGGGSDQFFSDVNRTPPPEQVAAVCFGLSPQVHAADDASLMENLPALADCVETARILRPGRPIAASSVTLVPPLGPYPAGAPVPGGLPGAVDVRQFGLFGASWTLGAVAWLAGVSTESATLFETAGPQGIVQREGGSAYDDLLPVEPGDAYPVLHVLADLAEWRDGALLDVRTSDPLAVTVLAVERAGSRGALVANHRPDPVTVVLRGLGAERAHVRRLDESTAEDAMVHPATFRRGGSEKPSPGGEPRLELAPYAVARVLA